MLRAKLDTDPRTEADHIGYLRFESLDNRGIDVIMVTDGPSYEMWPEREHYHRGPVWHIDVEPGGSVLVSPGIQLPNQFGNGEIVISPSIDIKDRYHTVNPIRFKLLPNCSCDNPFDDSKSHCESYCVARPPQ